MALDIWQVDEDGHVPPELHLTADKNYEFLQASVALDYNLELCYEVGHMVNVSPRYSPVYVEPGLSTREAVQSYHQSFRPLHLVFRKYQPRGKLRKIVERCVDDVRIGVVKVQRAKFLMEMIGQRWPSHADGTEIHVARYNDLPDNIAK
jgi:hypothetical protein